MPVMRRCGRLLPALVCGLPLLLAACAFEPEDLLQTPTSEAAGGSSQHATLMRLGDASMQSGDAGAAATMYRQAAILDRENPDAFIALGAALVSLEAYDQAALVYQDALDLSPGDSSANRGYGRVLLGLNRPQLAAGYFETVLAVDPHDLAAMNGLGVAYDMAGRHDEARAMYRQGLEIVPGNRLLSNNLGLSLALARRYDDAIVILRDVVDSRGASERNRQNLALAYGLAGNAEAAAQVGRVDLDDKAIASNLEYYAALRALDNGKRTAAAIGVHEPLPATSVDSEMASRHIAAVALDAGDLELGLSPAGYWFVNLGQYSGKGEASRAWTEMRRKHGDLLDQMTRLAGIEDGKQPLLVGPLADARAASNLCATLEDRGQACQPVSL